MATGAYQVTLAAGGFEGRQFGPSKARPIRVPANAHLPEFMADFNRRFAVAPRNPSDAHRAVLHDAREPDLILCEQHPRKLAKGLTVSFGGRTYQVRGQGRGRRLRGSSVTV